MADNKIIYGNVSAVKTSILERMKAFIDNVYDPGCFVPTEISEMMKEVTIDTNKEVAVFLDRKNRVLAVALGDDLNLRAGEVIYVCAEYVVYILTLTEASDLPTWTFSH